MDYGEWRTVPGFDVGKVMVSSGGWVQTKYGGGFADADGQRQLGQIRSGMHFRGHKVVSLDNKKYIIAELIAKAFIGERPSTAHSVIHKDGNVDNNQLSNLEWGLGYTSEYGEWRPVPGIDASKLLVSEFGFVRTQRRGGRVFAGQVRPLGKPYRGILNASETLGVCLHKKSYLVHRLVATAFHGPQPSPEHTVDHIDRNVQNNRASNLRWATNSEQQLNKGASAKKYNTGPTNERQDDLVVDGETEIWKAVSGTATLRVSSMGRLQRRVRTRWGPKRTPQPTKRHAGYVYVHVGGTKMVVHRLVMMTFVGPSDDPSKTTVDHLNNIRHDNRLANLRWASLSEQARNTVRGKRKRAHFSG